MNNNIHIHLFGQFFTTLGDEPLAGFRSDRVRALLAYLLVESSRPLSRIQLCQLLWEGYSLDAARANLRVSLSNLRQIFAPLDLIHATYHTVQFRNNHTGIWCDAIALERLARAPIGQPPPDELWFNLALQGAFLDGFDVLDSPPFQQWLAQRRTHYRQLAAEVSTPLTTRLKAATGPADEPASATPPPLVVQERLPGGAGAQTPTASALEEELAQAPHVDDFYGRTAELAQLRTWLTNPKCHFIAILGMGGQGKTALVAKAVRMMATEQASAGRGGGFAHVLWSSLLNAPPLSEILLYWVQPLSGQQVSQLPPSLDQQFDLLLGYLRRQRCLLVLDNAESIMSTGTRAGQFRPGYEGYGQLLQRIAEYEHQSCLVLTSREEPYTFKRLAVGAAPVGSLRLGGLAGPEAQVMLHGFGLTGSAEANGEVVRHYSGNPLALKLVAALVQELFAGDVQAFLAEETLVFDDIRDVLDQHFARLSATERDLLYWLAIEREPLPFAALYDDLVQPPLRREAVETMRSLLRRSLLEQDGERFYLQNVITEYLTDRLATTVCQEVADLGFGILDFGVAAPQSQIQNLKSKILAAHLNRYALVKAQAREYVRASQVRLLLAPVAGWLKAHQGKAGIALRFQALLKHLQTEMPLAPGYAAANLLHLLLHLNVDLRGYDLARLTIWQADLREANLPQVDLSGADLSGARFLEPFEIMRGLAVSPDGRLLATGAANGEIYMWASADQQVQRIFKGHTGPVYSLAFSPDGQRLATASGDRTTRLWDLSTGELYCILRGHTDEVVCVHFAASGEAVLTLSYDGTARLWDVRSQVNVATHKRTFDILGSGVAYIVGTAISADGRLAATAGSDFRIRCWEVETGQLRCILEGHTSYIDALTFSPDGALLASAGQDQTVRLWDVASPPDAAPDRLRHILSQPGDYSMALAFSPDGTTLASGGERVIRLWDGRTGALRRQLPGHGARVTTLAFNHNDVTLVSTSYDQTIRLWNANGGQAERTIYGRGYWVEEVSFSPDGETLAGSYFDCMVRVWARDGRPLHTLRGHTDPPRHIAYSPDGALLVSAGDDKTVRLWDVLGGGRLHTLHGHTDRVGAVVFHPSGTLLASAGDEQLIHIWDVETGEHYTQLAGRVPLAFGPAGAELAFGGTDYSLRLWDARTGQLRILPGHTDRVRSLAFHPQDGLLASVGNDKTLRLWDVARGQLLQTLGEFTQHVGHVTFSTDGCVLVSVSADQTIHIWMRTEEEGYQLRHTLVDPIFKSTCVALSPDGTVLATGNVQTTIHLWAVATGQVLHTLQGHTNLITAVSFHPDGGALLSGSSDGTLRLWDVQMGVCLNVLQPEGPYTGAKITGVTGITPAQKAALLALGAVEEA